MMCIRKSTVVWPCAFAAYEATALPSSVAGSMLKPTPGFSTCVAIRPSTSANVETISKYSSALPPTRPTFFMSCMPAMPVTTVQKMIGPITILISLMKPSPSGFMSTAKSGEKWPSAMPMMIATITWTYSTLWIGFFTMFPAIWVSSRPATLRIMRTNSRHACARH